jgi:two-component system phosphate regulon sensor histidine kinase PhoR
MDKVDASGTTVASVDLDGPTAESISSGEIPSDLCAAVLAMAGHDLRQPLQVIMTARDTLARTVRSGVEREHLTQIASAVMRASGMLDGLVDVLRMQRASPDECCAPVPLQPILQNLASEFTEPAKLKRIKLRVPPTSSVVYSHPVLLTGMLRNLMCNAIHHTPSGGRVLVACRRRGQEVYVEVRDNGSGLFAGQLKRVFGAFQRGDRTRTDGLGLGLFIVERATEFLGHRLEVRSSVGRGSCFVVIADIAPSVRVRGDVGA